MASDLRFREVEHTADRAFTVRGRDLAELFALAARALGTIQGQPADTRETISRQLEVSGVDRETLLVNWLNEILYLQDVHKESYSRFEVATIFDTSLRASLHGEPDASSRRTIKAVTFHGLKIERLPDGWEATIVVDV
ncbi:MAG TPA: archease [Terriglobales bacterium]|nr:archease [Terriglobales bacterium]